MQFEFLVCKVTTVCFSDTGQCWSFIIQVGELENLKNSVKDYLNNF